MIDRGVVVFGKVESGTIRLGNGLKLMPSGMTCQVLTIYNSKEECVNYAKPGENVKLRLNIDNEDKVNKGDVLCMREQVIVPVSELFEAEVELLELVSYKPILSKGYQCILHMHTVAYEATIKDILVSYEKNDRGEVIEKQRPQFTRSFSKIICRIQMRIPIPLEKHDVLPQLGRFTLRDEGKTIAVGKVLKYKPAKEVAQSFLPEEVKKPTPVAPDLIYDMETGETLTREENEKRKKEREKAGLTGIAEDEEGSDDDEGA